jgi:GH35 family endo-1,4-beta-xylanase
MISRFFLCVAGAFALFGAAIPFFDGVDDASQPVMDAARRRIEEIRKGDFQVALVDANGKPVHGEVHLRLARHEFRFGADLYGFPRLPEAARKQAEAVVDELFNTVIVVNYWRKPDFAATDQMLAWAGEHGKTTRFHALLYNVPLSFSQTGSDEERWKAIEDRIKTIAERYGSRIHEYDVLNEIACDRWVWGKHPDSGFFAEPAHGARCFRLARKYLPDAELLNTDATFATRTSPALEPILKYSRDLLGGGAPIDVIGHQAHFYSSGKMPFQEGHSAYGGAGAFTMKMLEGGLDRLASLGKPVHITEFSPPSRDNKKQGEQPALTDDEIAAWQVNYYTLAFSKPYIHEITRWFVIDELGGRGVDAGLITRDGKLKPAYYALKRLLTQTWRTDWRGEAVNGAISFRGFFGEYEVEVQGYQNAVVSARSTGPTSLSVKLVANRRR